MSDVIWSTLGIAPTDDAAEIRRAYARRLKAIDVDTDPQAFVGLREAMEAALEDAVWAREEVLADSVAREPDAPTADISEPVSDGTARHMQAIEALLYDNAQPWLDAEQKFRLLEHWSAITGDPRLDQLAFFDSVQHWASRVIVETSPRSSPLVGPAVARFGWTDDGDIMQDFYVAEIMRRHRVLKFLEESRRPGHPCNQAWVELSTRAYRGSNRGRVDPRTVYDVLSSVRDVMPEYELGFDPLRVELWKRNTAAPDFAENAQSAATNMHRAGFIVRVLMAAFALSFLINLVRDLAS